MIHISESMLENILSKDIPIFRGEQIWIWGAGDTSQLYQEGFKRLTDEGFRIEGYIDNNSSKVGRTFCGKPVIAPIELGELKNICVLLCSIQPHVIKEVGAQLRELSVEWHLMDEVILKLHRNDVMSCYRMLFDEKSKDIFANLIKWRITGEKTDVEVDNDNDYLALPPFVESHPDEVFVDCGAWTGDIEERYIEKKNGVFKKIIAFEPDKVNFERLQKTVKKLKEKWDLEDDAFALYPCGVGDKTGKAYFERYEVNNGLGSKFNMSNDGNCDIVSLDEYLTEPYSFLKADIESFEYRMLIGAEKGIKKYKPLLTICLYHNAVDLYSIPLLVKDMVPEYKVAIRHHDDWLTGTVMYAWI